MRRKKQSKLKEVFERFKNYLYILISIILVISLTRNINRIRKAEERIDRARERVNNLDEQRNELETRLKEAQSEVYLESQLRDGLGLAREDDIVIVLPEEEVLRRIAPDIEEEPIKMEDSPNWEKWLKLFITLEG